MRTINSKANGEHRAPNPAPAEQPDIIGGEKPQRCAGLTAADASAQERALDAASGGAGQAQGGKF